MHDGTSESEAPNATIQNLCGTTPISPSTTGYADDEDEGEERDRLVASALDRTSHVVHRRVTTRGGDREVCGDWENDNTEYEGHGRRDRGYHRSGHGGIWDRHERNSGRHERSHSRRREGCHRSGAQCNRITTVAAQP
jgi:hypothetical protein